MFMAIAKVKRFKKQNWSQSRILSRTFIGYFCSSKVHFRSMEKIFTPLFQRLLFLFVLAFSTFYPSAQELHVTCKIVDNKNEPVPFASVAIYQRTDTLISETKVADSSGMTSFVLQKDVQYFVRISATGYLSSEKGIVANSDFFSFTIESITKTLKEVEVISQKPLIRQEDVLSQMAELASEHLADSHQEHAAYLASTSTSTRLSSPSRR
jgi:hypothetical protein